MASKKESLMDLLGADRRPDHIEVVAPPLAAQGVEVPLIPTPAPEQAASAPLAPVPPSSTPGAQTVGVPAGAAVLGQSHRGMRRSRRIHDLSDTEGEEEEISDARRKNREARKILDMNSMGRVVCKVMGALVEMAEAIDNEKVDAKLPDLADLAILTQKIRSAPPSEACDASEKEEHLEAFAKRAYLQPHTADHIVRPPSDETFTESARSKSKKDRTSHAIKQYFGQQKVFSGSGSPREPKIVELLCDATRAQEQLCLPKEEFLDELSRKFTHDAWELFLSCRRSEGNNVKSIYECLLNQYDKRPKPQQAMEKLNSLQSESFESLTAMVQEINLLSARACLVESCPESQDLVRDHYSKMTLLRLLPLSLKYQIQHNLESLEASMPSGRVSFKDLVQIARRYRPQIDGILEERFRNKRSRAAVRSLEAPRPTETSVDPSTGARSKTSRRGDAKPAEGKNGGASSKKDKRKSKKENLVDFDPRTGEEPKFESQAGIQRCFKCNGTGHRYRDCPIQGELARTVCTLCPLEARHQEAFCPFALADKYRKAVLGPASSTNQRKGN